MKKLFHAILAVVFALVFNTLAIAQQAGNERFMRSRFSFTFSAGTSIAPKPEIKATGGLNEYPLSYSASNSPMFSLIFGYRNKNKVDYYFGIDFIAKSYSASTILVPITGWSEQDKLIRPGSSEDFRTLSLGVGKSIHTANDFDIKFLYALGVKLASSVSHTETFSRQDNEGFIWVKENYTSPSTMLHSLKVMPTWHFKLMDIGLITGVQYFHQPPIYGGFTLLPSQPNASSYSVSTSRWQIPLQISFGKRL